MPQLLIQHGDKAPQSIALEQDHVVIGRHPDCSVVLNDESVSGRHAEIERRGRSYYLCDQGSSNGTTVNGAPVTEIELKDGDSILFGRVNCIFRFTKQELPPSPVPPPSSTGQPTPAKESEPGHSAGQSLKGEIRALNLLQLLTSSAALGKKQATRKKLELVDLRQAELKIGLRAYESGLLTDEFAETHAQLMEIDRCLHELGKPSEREPAQSLKESARTAADTVKRKGQEQILAQRRQKLLASAGRAIRTKGTVNDGLNKEVLAAEALAERIHALDTEIARIEQQAPFILRRPLWLAGGICLIVLYLLVAPTLNMWSAKAQARRLTTQIQEQAQHAADSAVQAAKRDLERARQARAEVQSARETGQQQQVDALHSDITEVRTKFNTELIPLKTKIASLEAEKARLLEARKKILQEYNLPDHE